MIAMETNISILCQWRNGSNSYKAYSHPVLPLNDSPEDKELMNYNSLTEDDYQFEFAETAVYFS